MEYPSEETILSENMMVTSNVDFATATVAKDAKETTTGRWTAEEHQLFLEGLRQHKKQWKLIADLIKTRTVVQIRTHAQKYFQKLLKSNKTDEYDDAFIQELVSSANTTKPTSDDTEADKKPKTSRSRTDSTVSLPKAKKVKTESAIGTTAKTLTLKINHPLDYSNKTAPQPLSYSINNDHEDFDIAMETSDWFAENSVFMNINGVHDNLSMEFDYHFDDVELAWLAEATGVNHGNVMASSEMSSRCDSPLRDVSLGTTDVSDTSSDDCGATSPKAIPDYDVVYPTQRITGKPYSITTSSRKRGRPRRNYSADDIRESTSIHQSKMVSGDSEYIEDARNGNMGIWDEDDLVGFLDVFG